MDFRIEKDTIGDVQVPADKLWGAQTQRSFMNFKIGHQTMPKELICALALVKKAAAAANAEAGVLPDEKRKLIADCCDEILAGKLDQHFPLCVWQTGSGTQTNMNVNEVVANRAEIILHKKIDVTNRYISPNDDVNKSQSTNDVFPTAMRVAASMLVLKRLVPSVERLLATMEKKASDFRAIVKIGRTHLMDATPLTLGQEFSAFAAQLKHGLEAIANALPHLMELPLGGTAVGTGLNTPKGYDVKAVSYLNQYTGMEFLPAGSKFEAMASHDSFVEMSGALKRLAVSLMKIANDVRLLASGPRCGLGELKMPANEPGSSIMPGKVNPTQCEALSMVCCQVIGNDVAIATGAIQGHLQLNVFMPLIARNIIDSIELLADATNSFNDHCAEGLIPDKEMIEKHLRHSLMLVTALNPHIGYYNAAKIANYALEHGLTLKEAALKLELVSADDFDRWVDPSKMV